MDACHFLLVSRPGLFDNHVIHDGDANIYSPNHNGYNLKLTPLLPPKHLQITPTKGSKKILFKSETLDACSANKSKPQIVLLMAKPKTSEKVNPLRPMAPLSSHANVVELMHGLTFKRPLLSNLSLGVEISKIGLSMSSISLEHNEFDFTCNQGIKAFNKLMVTKNFRANSS